MTATHPAVIEVSRSLRPSFQDPHKAMKMQMKFAPTSSDVGDWISMYEYLGGAVAHVIRAIEKITPRYMRRYLPRRSGSPVFQPK
jgi:hypothetical protein